MSGSGGGGGGGGGPPRADCDIVETTILNSPQPDVVNRLKELDELDVVLDDSSLVATLDGDIAGSLTCPSVPELIDCIDKGHEYIAVVLKIDLGMVHVEVRRK